VIVLFSGAHSGDPGGGKRQRNANALVITSAPALMAIADSHNNIPVNATKPSGMYAYFYGFGGH
jgi:hypothetical protein